jgi:serine/threonine protein kinase
MLWSGNTVSRVRTRNAARPQQGCTTVVKHVTPDATTLAPQAAAGPAEAWSSLRGRRVGRDGLFELQQAHAQGGMGEVWAAWMHDPHAPRRVAVKLIRRGLDSDLASELFAREVEMHERVKDVPGVVPLIESGWFPHPDSGERVHFFAMEWIAGARPLREACRSRSLDEVISLFASISATMDVVHKRAVVHCDLKPANLLVDETGKPWVTDFGLAISTRTHERRHTGRDIGSLRGTWTHMAPEQCDDRCDPYSYTAAVDVYALGVTLFECLFGRLPYAAATEVAVERSRAATMIGRGVRVPRRCDGRTIPFALRRCLIKAMASNPAARHADAGELERDLRPLAIGAASIDRRTALIGAAVACLVSWTILTPLLHHPAIYTNWYALISRLVPAAPLRDVAIVGIRGELSSDAKGGERYANLELEALSKRPSGSSPAFDPSTSERVFLSRVIDRLRELDVKVVMLDYYFPREGVAADAARLIASIKAFRGDDAAPRGWICFGTQDWKAPEGSTLVERNMLDVATLAFALTTNLGMDAERMSHEVALRDATRHDWASASMMAAAASLSPLAELGVHVDVRDSTKGAQVEFQFRSRRLNAATRESITLRTDASSVEDLSRGADASTMYPGLDARDVICTIDLPRLPETSVLDRATLHAADLWSADERDLRRRLEGCIVVVGDLITRREPAQTDPTIDRWSPPGASSSRPVWGVELQAVGVQAARDAILGIGQSINSDGGLLVNLGVPIAAAIGVGLAWRSSRRRDRSESRRLMLICLAILALGTLAALGTYAAWLWLWNPFILPATFAAATLIGFLSPWMRTAPR